jgi:hypothetical protein
MNILAFFEFGVREIMLLALIMLAFPILVGYCLVDIIKSDFKDSTAKLIWVLIVLFAPILGSIIYLSIGRKSKITRP